MEEKRRKPHDMCENALIFIKRSYAKEAEDIIRLPTRRDSTTEHDMLLLKVALPLPWRGGQMIGML